ncbi:MAG: hypothetical protein ACFFCF_01075 [Promethearchaeota archaeon]
MSEWIIKLVNNSIHHFVDLQKAIGQYYELQSGWIHKLQACIETEPAYSAHINLIDTIAGPGNEKLLAPFLLLLITKTHLTVTFLGELTENETAYIVGVWPKKFLQILKTDKDAILNLLYIITDQPQLVDNIDVYF